MDTNTIMIILLLSSLLLLQGVGVYLLLKRKRFKITSESAAKDIESFLNSLDEEISERAVSTEKLLDTFIQEIKKQENSKLNMIYELKDNNQNVVEKVSQEVIDGQIEVKKIISLLNEMLKDHLGDVGKKISIMKEEVKAVKELTEEKNKTIRRYEDGYDRKNIKQFEAELFKIIDYIKKERELNDNNALEEVEEDLILMLEKNGIQLIEIDVGDSYEGQSRYAKVTGTEETDDESEDTIIKEVNRNGYFVQIDENNTRVLRPAEVVVYKLIQKEGEENNG